MKLVKEAKRFVELSYSGDYVDHAGRDDRLFPGADNVWHDLPDPIVKLLKDESMISLVDFLEARPYKVTIRIEAIEQSL